MTAESENWTTAQLNRPVSKYIHKKYAYL